MSNWTDPLPSPPRDISGNDQEVDFGDPAFVQDTFHVYATGIGDQARRGFGTDPNHEQAPFAAKVSGGYIRGTLQIPGVTTAAYATGKVFGTRLQVSGNPFGVNAASFDMSMFSLQDYDKVIPAGGIEAFFFMQDATAGSTYADHGDFTMAIATVATLTPAGPPILLDRQVACGDSNMLLPTTPRPRQVIHRDLNTFNMVVVLVARASFTPTNAAHYYLSYEGDRIS